MFGIQVRRFEFFSIPSVHSIIHKKIEHILNIWIKKRFSKYEQYLFIISDQIRKKMSYFFGNFRLSLIFKLAFAFFGFCFNSINSKFSFFNITNYCAGNINNKKDKLFKIRYQVSAFYVFLCVCVCARASSFLVTVFHTLLISKETSQ